METLTRAELIVALAITVLFFAISFFSSPRKSVPLLLCLIPFQGLENAQSTLNVLLVYALAVAFALKGRLRYVPMLVPVLLLIGAYLVSSAFAHPNTRMDHAIYIFNFASAILMFYIAYNFMRTYADPQLVVRTLLSMNFLVLLYCAIQLFHGQFDPFGLHDLRITRPREGDDTRLSGPFKAVGITAEYLVLNIILLMYLSVQWRGWYRLGSYLLIGANTMMLVATANRGGFLVLIGATVLFLFTFRAEIGLKRTLGLALAGSIMLSAASVVIVNFTEMSDLYGRLEATEIETGVPDTRVAVWSAVLPEIQKRPLLGHGPYFYGDQVPFRGFQPIPFPHNLYLYILYTVGAIGFLAYALFFGSILHRLMVRVIPDATPPLLSGLVRLGPILLIAVVIDQLKVEALRMSLIDYWHFLFGLLGLWLAMADHIRIRRESVEEVSLVPTEIRWA